jgi:hypothetical protein
MLSNACNQKDGYWKPNPSESMTEIMIYGPALLNKRGRESFYDPLGRPRARKVDSNPSRLAICTCHRGRPKGRPR